MRKVERRKNEHPLYTRWQGMMRRCYKPYNSHYKCYGAKGITVCERWHEFWNFVEDVDNHLSNGHLLYEKGWELDKDIKGGTEYNLENCTVISRDENSKIAYTKQQRKILAFNENEKMEFESIANASRALNVQRSSIGVCLKRGNRHKPSGYYFKYSS